MSADNWAICPKCKKIQEKKADENIKMVAAAYGKVPEDEYLKMKKELLNPPKQEDSLREDYELGIDDEGTFSISYSAYCSECGFKFLFEQTEDTFRERAD